jgi:hypothetical protein
MRVDGGTLAWPRLAADLIELEGEGGALKFPSSSSVGDLVSGAVTYTDRGSSFRRIWKVRGVPWASFAERD